MALDGSSGWRRWIEALAAAVFPTRCLACREFFAPGSETGGFEKPEQGCEAADARQRFSAAVSKWICPACAGTFQPVQPPICLCCGEVFRSREQESHLCGSCITAPRPFESARAAGLYEGALMKAVHLLKYNGKIQLAAPLARLLFAVFTDLFSPDSVDLIAPVPLHPARMRERGFNQAYLLIRGWPALAAQTGMPWKKTAIAKDLLVRGRKTAPQTGLGRQDRKKNLMHAFGVPDPAQVDGKAVVLVDDVFTTGATADACATELMRSGASRVEVLTLARAVG